MKLTDTKHGHVPVLLEPVLSLLSPKAGQVAIDCTTGRAGHSLAIAKHLGPTGRLICLDVDQNNLHFAREQLSNQPTPVDYVHVNFARIYQTLNDLNVNKVDLLLADIGFASNQLDDPTRGLSFKKDGPLDMRLDPTQGLPAAELISRLDERELAQILFEFGEEKLSRKIASKIVEKREQSPIKTTTELALIAREVYRRCGVRTRIDPATRTFMALRIAVNQELAALDRLLEDLSSIMCPNGVAAIISFHSLEDRRVKQAFARYVKKGQAEQMTKKPIVATPEEMESNSRSRSAKLRAIRFRPLTHQAA